MFEYAEYQKEDVVTMIEHVQRADELRNIHVIHTLHADSLSSVHSKDVAGYLGPGETALCMKETGKFIKEKVLRKEIILKSEQLAFSLYDDRTHLYAQSLGIRWLDRMKNRHRYVLRLKGVGTPSDKMVKNLICLHFDVSSDLGFNVDFIDDDDESMGADSSRGGVGDGEGGLGDARRICCFRRHSEHCTSFIRCRTGDSDRGWRSDDFLGPCVSHRGRVAPTPGVIPGVGPLAN